MAPQVVSLRNTLSPHLAPMALTVSRLQCVPASKAFWGRLPAKPRWSSLCFSLLCIAGRCSVPGTEPGRGGSGGGGGEEGSVMTNTKLVSCSKPFHVCMWGSSRKKWAQSDCMPEVWQDKILPPAWRGSWPSVLGVCWRGELRGQLGGVTLCGWLSFLFE